MCCTSDTTVVTVCGTEFTVAFLQPDLHYHIRAGSSAERDRWVAALADAIRQQSEAASPATPPPPPAPAFNLGTGEELLSAEAALSSPSSSPAQSSAHAFARVLFDFEADNAEELTLKVDQFIEVTRDAIHSSN